ncbi:TPA: hypothetical protein ACG3P3_001478 [Clostridioides difficile]
MQPFITAFSSWFLNKDENEQRFKIMYVKSLFYMILIVLSVCNFFFGNTVSEIKNFFGDTILKYLSLFLTIGLQFFTVLTVISLILFAISVLLDCIHDKLIEIEKDYKFMKRIKDIHLGNLIYGSFDRFKCSLEDIMIFLIAAYLLDYDVFIQYKSIYNESLWILLLIVMFLAFIIFSLGGIINRFFKLRDILEEEFLSSNSKNQNIDGELSPQKNGDTNLNDELPPLINADTNLNSELILLRTMNQNMEKEILFLEAENNKLREKDLNLKEQDATEKYI